MMIINKNIKKINDILKKLKEKDKRIGFVPTMGALHKGHLSLVEQALKECDFVVVSIFINPLQFSKDEDLNKYPRNLNKDKSLLKFLGVDLLFIPKVSLMYGLDHSVYIEESALSKRLCGKSRPGHFKGVCTILTKLFNIIKPDVAYFGQKDYQQALIIKKLAYDLNFSIRIKVMPIVRDNEGLALSSRNVYLNPKQYKQSLCLFNSLNLAKRMFNQGEREARKFIRKMKEIILREESAKIDYIEVVDAHDLKPLKKISSRVVIILAVYIDRVRLIDNIILNVKK